MVRIEGSSSAQPNSGIYLVLYSSWERFRERRSLIGWPRLISASHRKPLVSKVSPLRSSYESTLPAAYRSCTRIWEDRNLHPGVAKLAGVGLRMTPDPCPV